MPGRPGKQELRGDGSDDVREKKKQSRLESDYTVRDLVTTVKPFMRFTYVSSLLKHSMNRYILTLVSTLQIAFFTLIQIRHAIY